MDSFLQIVASDVFKKYPMDMHEVCILFPNRRAGIFFNKYLAQLINRPVWAPQIRSIGDLMQEFSGLQQGDPLTLLYSLYQVYGEVNHSDESFDDFYYWGEMLISDFDDIDKYLADPGQIFQNLADIKEIDRQFTIPEEKMQLILEFWNHFNINDKSTLKQNFTAIWEKLLEVYENYRTVLYKRKIGYEGMMYRDVVTKIQTNRLINPNYKSYVIAGFNALNECEKALFTYLKNNHGADFYWDYDDYYVNNQWHEAGHFMRENLQLFPQASDRIIHNSLTQPKNIEIVSIPSDIGQTKMATYFFESWKCSFNEMTETAIVLADEHLLVPLLSSIPSYIENVNVTLGYPLKFTPVASFFEGLVVLQRNLKKQGEGRPVFYFRDVLVLLNHPYIQRICPDEANDLANQLTKTNLVFITVDAFQSHEYLIKVFRIFESASELLKCLREIGSHTVSLLQELDRNSSRSAFDREYWFTFLIALNRLQDIIDTENIITGLHTIYKIIQKLINGISIPFKGEPLAGLQIMGVLETRALDFKNMILLSVNEGVMPKTEASSSFLPYNLRRGFGLPTIEHQDAVYAYYFYRLMQRAENVALIYNSQTGNRAVEMSRFLYQLRYEPSFTIKEKGLNFKVSLSDDKEITIHKNQSVEESLQRYYSTVGTDCLTPTAINAYLDCSLRFYFRYVARLHPMEEISENLEGAMFGKLLHHAMDLIYRRYLRKTIHESDLEILLKDDEFLESCVLKAFAVEFFKKPDQEPKLYGKSLIVKEVLMNYIRQIIRVDKKYAPLTMLEFEKTVQTTLPVEIHGKSALINVGGKIDRLDQTNGTHRVVDYKTGKVNLQFNRIEQLFEVEGDSHNKDALQILLYAIILGDDKTQDHLPVTMAIYGLRELFKTNFDPRLKLAKKEIENSSQVRDSYLNGLRELLSDIFNPDIPFTKVSDPKKCEFCDYIMICHR